MNGDVGEGCPGEGSQVQDCQERNCPGDMGNLKQQHNCYGVKKRLTYIDACLNEELLAELIKDF